MKRYMKQSPSPRGTLNTGIYYRGTSNVTFLRELREGQLRMGVSRDRTPAGITLPRGCSRGGCRMLRVKPAYLLGYKAKRGAPGTPVKSSQGKRCISYPDPLYSFLRCTHIFASVPPLSRFFSCGFYSSG